MKILITGAKGQLGLTLKDVLSQHDLLLTDRKELDITDSLAVDQYLKKTNPKIIINTAAYTAVDKAEEEEKLAYKINALGPKNLAKSAKQNGVVFYHISTDFVFDGKNKIPYTEDDEPKPISVYGQTKYQGEEAVEQIGGQYYIFRTAWLYSPYGKNFVKTIVKLGQEKDELNIVADQIGSPTYTYDLAKVIKQFVNKEFRQPYGLYHYAGDGFCSWYRFADQIVKLSGGKAKILKTTTYKYGSKAARPAYSVLDCSKIKSFGIKTIPWQESLKKCINILLK